MIKIERRYISVTLLCCFLQMAGIALYAQQPIDSLIVHADSLAQVVDALEIESQVVDSIAAINEENMAKLDSITNPEMTLLSADTIVAGSGTEIPRKVWVPNPTRATWLAVVIPGGGQIYNRKYWKLPIVYGGFAGCAYALSWNNRMFKDYSQAYSDIMDKDPQTNSYYDLLPPGLIIDEKTDTRWNPILKKRKDYYRRYRDLSVFAFIGVYVLSIIDAYVDAELSNFDITPDLSMRVEPVVMDTRQRSLVGNKGTNAVGLQCSFSF